MYNYLIIPLSSFKNSGCKKFNRERITLPELIISGYELNLIKQKFFRIILAQVFKNWCAVNFINEASGFSLLFILSSSQTR